MNINNGFDKKMIQETNLKSTKTPECIFADRCLIYSLCMIIHYIILKLYLQYIFYK